MINLIRKLIFSFTAICLLSLGANSFAQQVPAVPYNGNSDSLSLNYIIEEIINSHPTVRSAEEALNAADAKISLAKTGYLPDISASVNYSFIGPVVKLSIPIPGYSGSLQLYPENNYSAGLTYKQSIYDFGRTRQNVEIENENKAITELTIEQVKQKMAMSAVNNFYTLAYLQDAIIIKEKELENLNNHLKFVQAKQSTGSATEYEILVTQVRISNVESQKVDLQTNLKVQQSYLCALLGLPENGTPVVRKELTAEIPSVSGDSLVTYALRNRQEILLNMEKISAAEMREKLIKSLNRPYLGFSATGGAKNGYQPELGQLKMNYVIGVGLTIPVFDANKTKYNFEQARSSVISLNFENESTKRVVSSEVIQAQENVKSAYQRVQQFGLILTQAERANSLAEVSFQAGAITNLDLLDAATAVSQARLQLLKAKIDYAAGIYMLKAAIGEKLY